ncbi:hypothetical protein MAM1_0042c02992 [Mucor ambiguus]|uniref:GATA-type domain-containing protein n=1 Tax=Mucor ambiguus TaxID=91626 RepID=A0A0C9MK50_9FUNG|nr:hypothetical protein MAM1_0042c02992 [Mucor ambiguus]
MAKSSSIPSVDQSAANIKTASYGLLDNAIVSLDSRFSVEAAFFEVWSGDIDTPRELWRFERTIFCLESKNDKNNDSGFYRQGEYFVLPAEALVHFSNDKAPHEAILSFHFDYKSIEIPDIDFHDDMKPCYVEKPGNKYIQNRVGEVSKGSYIANLRISKKLGLSCGIKEALNRMDARFQRVYNCMMEVRSSHQLKIQVEENEMPKTNESNTTIEPPNQAKSNRIKPTSPKKTTKSTAPSPKKSSLKNIDATNSDKECTYCARKTTPMWRRGPAGPGTLCNACGVKWRHGKILCSDNSTETALFPSTATTENVNPLNTTKSNSTRIKRKYTKSTETSQPAKKLQKKIEKKNNTATDVVQARVFEIFSSPSSSVSPHSFDLNTLIVDEAHHALGVDAVEAAAVLTLLKRS